MCERNTEMISRLFQNNFISHVTRTLQAVVSGIEWIYACNRFQRRLSIDYSLCLVSARRWFTIINISDGVTSLSRMCNRCRHILSQLYWRHCV